MKGKFGIPVFLLAASVAPGHAQETAADDDSRTLRIEVKKTIEFEKRVGGCEASLNLEYWQKGDVAEVTSTITNSECGASSGDYTISVRYRSDAGEMQTDEYPETWAREDSQPVVTTRMYPIGDDVDLIRVRSRGLSCRCSDESADQPD